MKSFQCPFLTLVHSGLRWSVWLLMATCLLACNDDEDLPSPRITIQKPTENQLLQAVDTVIVEGVVTDAVGIEQIEIQLVNQDFASASDRQTYPASGTTFNFSLPFLLDEPLLSSGTYYVAVRAKSGERTGSSFKRVQLSAIPRVLEETMVATKSSFAVTLWTREEGETDWEARLMRNMDCIGAALNYRQNILAIAGGEVGNLEFYDTEEYEMFHSVAGLGTPSLPFFLGLTYDTAVEEFLVLLREPRMRIFDHLGAGVTGFPLRPDHLPSAGFAAIDHYFAVESPISLPNQLLTVYARPGLLMATVELGGPALGVFGRNASEVYVWENHPEGAKLRLANIDTQLVQDIFQRSDEELIDVVEISTGVFAFLTDAGLYRYTYNTGGTVVISGGITGNRLFYEALSQTYYVADGHNLMRIAPNGAVIGTSTFSDQVLWVGFNYNR